MPIGILNAYNITPAWSATEGYLLVKTAAGETHVHASGELEWEA